MDGRFGPNFERGIAGIHGRPNRSEFVRCFKRDAGTHGPPNRSEFLKKDPRAAESV